MALTGLLALIAGLVTVPASTVGALQVRRGLRWTARSSPCRQKRSRGPPSAAAAGRPLPLARCGPQAPH